MKQIKRTWPELLHLARHVGRRRDVDELEGLRERARAVEARAMQQPDHRVRKVDALFDRARRRVRRKA